MLSMLSGVLSGAMGGNLSTVIKMGMNFGMLDPKLGLIVNGIMRAPAPAQKVLGENHLENLDVIAHNLGCMVCGVFDELVEGMSAEEMAELELDDVVLPDQPIVRMALEGSFELLKQVYREYGDLTDAVAEGKFDPGGLLVQSMIGAWRLKQDQDLGTASADFGQPRQFLKKRGKPGSLSGSPSKVPDGGVVSV